MPPSLEDTCSGERFSGGADYKIVYHENNETSTCFIPGRLVSRFWHRQIMKLNGLLGESSFPNMETTAIIGLVEFFCGDNGFINWARDLRRIVPRRDLSEAKKRVPNKERRRDLSEAKKRVPNKERRRDLSEAKKRVPNKERRRETTITNMVFSRKIYRTLKQATS